MDQVVAQALTTLREDCRSVAPGSAGTQTEPRSKRFHLALDGGLMPAERNGHGSDHSTKGNGNDHTVKRRGRMPALEGASDNNGNGHSPGNGKNGNGKQKLVSNGNGNGNSH